MMRILFAASALAILAGPALAQTCSQRGTIVEVDIVDAGATPHLISYRTSARDPRVFTVETADPVLATTAAGLMIGQPQVLVISSGPCPPEGEGGDVGVLEELLAD
jgi:hypothetical protein